MASETTTNNSIKRRKTDGSVATSLSNLPIGILEHTASFLGAPSRALFAVARATDENNPQSDNSSIAGADHWDTLDFGEIDKDLAAKLSDDDISDVLRHIDAVNKLKRLRLTNCTNITGEGLEPLRDSTIIEQIDLSMVGDGENPRLLDPDPPISCEDVLPILDSIIAAEGCALKHLQFPYKWRKRRDRSTASEFHAFIERYNEMREARDTISCLKCYSTLPVAGRRWIGTQGGLHNCTCYQCIKHYCDGCTDILQYCQICQRDYCKGCAKFEACEICEDIWACEHCSKACNECKKTICIDCIGRDKAYGCSYCSVAYCSACVRMKFCEQCRTRCCDSCRLHKYYEGGSDHCVDCTKLLPHEVALVEQSTRRLQQEVEHLKKENGELKDANKELQDENKELRGNSKSMAG